MRKMLYILSLCIYFNASFAAGPAATVGSPTSHGGTVIVGSSNVLIGGSLAARTGDFASCPLVTPGLPPIPHIGGNIIQGSGTVFINGLPAARVGDLGLETGPGQIISTGVSTVIIGD